MAAVDRLRRHWVPTAIGLLVVVALALRLYDLGGRVAHFDEARVGFWTYWYLETGFWEYRPFVHGPFLFHVNETLFGWFGMSDVVMRLPVALIAGLSPAAAWLYRDHLRRVEVVALAALLAITPVLLYYGRFSRNDMILATMMLVGLGFLLRAVATRRPRYLYLAVIAIAFGFTMKENAVLYLVSWVGAGVIVAIHRMGFERVAARLGRSPKSWQLRSRLQWPSVDRDWLRHGALGGLVGLAILVVFYAPRGSDDSGLGELVSAPWRLPAVIDASVFRAARELYDHWVVSHERLSYIDQLEIYLEVIAAGALAVALLAIIGLVLEHRRPDGPRWIVIFGAAWAILSIGGYAYAAGTPPRSAWIAVHMVVPMALPAAVGAGFLVDRCRGGLADRDHVEAVGSGLLLLAAIGLLVWPAYGLVYVDHSSSDNDLVQGAQIGHEWAEPLEHIEALVTAEERELDVLYYGSTFGYHKGDSEVYGHEPWFDAVPMPWYDAAFGAETDATQLATEFAERFDAHAPPVVITDATGASDIAHYLDGYEEITVAHGWLHITVHMYLDLDRLDNER